MGEQDIFEMQDENGVMREARIIDKIEINGQDYLIYALSINEEEDGIYVSKVINNVNGEEEIVNIQDDNERDIVINTVREVINNL